MSTWVWANSVATLLIGPPISNAVIPPRILPNTTFPLPAIPASQLFIASIILAIGFPIIQITTEQTKKVPING